MKRFQELLKPDLDSPVAEQERASRELHDMVISSRLYWWSKVTASPNSGKFLLVVVAPWSNYDLALLDLLDDLDTFLPVYVANLQQFETIEQLTEVIPTVTTIPPQTPVVAFWVDGGFRDSAFGKLGRDLVATTLGLVLCQR